MERFDRRDPGFRELGFEFFPDIGEARQFTHGRSHFVKRFQRGRERLDDDVARGRKTQQHGADDFVARGAVSPQ